MGTKKLAVSHAGSQGVFGLVEKDLLKQLASHHTELVYGHKSYRVNVDIVSHPFEVAMGKMDEKPSNQIMLHIFWTDAEAEAYRGHVKDQLTVWFDRLSKYNCNNYLIIHATFQDKSAILHKFSVTRTSMSERVRNDFGSQRADKTITFKADSNNIASSQSWLIAVSKIRDSIIKSVTLKLATMEKSVNQLRDSHEDEDFNLFRFIEAKENLALLYELTGLYEEGYRSGEEVLSLFRQYVLKLRQCQIVPWIEAFIEKDITNWSGISLASEVAVKDFDPDHVDSIQICSLIFRRIAHQLIHLQNPRDLAKKGLSFLLQTLQDCSILKVKYPRGALVVWVYIACIEILEAVKRSSPLNNMDVPEALAVAKGQLYNLAREKLLELGGLCGHVGENDSVLSSSEVAALVKGSRPVTSSSSSNSSNLTADLHKLLTDKSFFHKQYIDLCQLSIVSFKQGAWNRHAQLIMMRQALYLRDRGLQSECLNAETHLRDVCHAYATQGWHKLATFTRVKLCDTQRHLGLLDRELTTCCHLSTETDHITQTDRQTYSRRLVECVAQFNISSERSEDQILIPYHPLFQHSILETDNTDSCLLSGDEIRVKGVITLSVTLVNSSTEPIDNATVSLVMDTGIELQNRSKSVVSDAQDFSMVPIESNSEILEDGLYGISLKADSELMTAAGPDDRVGEVSHSLILSSHPTTLHPGSNQVVLSATPSHAGIYGVSSLQVQVGCVVFRQKSPSVPMWMESVEVASEASSVRVEVVQPPAGVLVADMKQNCTLAIWTEKAFHSLTITLKTPSDGLTLTPVENGTYTIEGEEDPGVFSLEKQSDSSWHLILPALLPRKLIHLPVPLIGQSDQVTIPVARQRVSDCVTRHVTQHQFHVLWTGGSVSLQLCFHQPFLTEVKYRYHGDEIYLISEITSNLPTRLCVKQCSLTRPGSLQSIVPFTELQLMPRQKFCQIWRMSMSSGQFPKEGTIELEYCLPLSEDRHKFDIPVDVAPKDPHFTVEMSCLTPDPQESELCEFEVAITTVLCESSRGGVWRLLCGVNSPRGEWVACGEQRRQLNISDSARFTVSMFPLTHGRLEYPKVCLWEYKDPQLQTTGTSRDLFYINEDCSSQRGELTPLSPRESDPLMVRSSSLSDPLLVRTHSNSAKKRAVSALPKAERVDYSTGKERVKVVSSIILNSLTDENIAGICNSRLCLNNSLSMIEVAPA